MDDLRHWVILDTIFTIFICFQMGMWSQKYGFVSKGHKYDSRFPGLSTQQ